MKPSVGRIVIAPVNPMMNNGAEEAPAVITRVWNEHPDGGWVINMRVLCDSENVLWLTSVRLFDTEQDAREHGQYSAYWPPRV